MKFETPDSYRLHIEARAWKSRQVAAAIVWLADSAIGLVGAAFRLITAAPYNARMSSNRRDARTGSHFPVSSAGGCDDLP